jgi:hypothetical protein
MADEAQARLAVRRREQRLRERSTRAQCPNDVLDEREHRGVVGARRNIAGDQERQVGGFAARPEAGEGAVARREGMKAREPLAEESESVRREEQRRARAHGAGRSARSTPPRRSASRAGQPYGLCGCSHTSDARRCTPRRSHGAAPPSTSRPSRPCPLPLARVPRGRDPRVPSRRRCPDPHGRVHRGPPRRRAR